jgi:hypothetical protein
MLRTLFSDTSLPEQSDIIEEHKLNEHLYRAGISWLHEFRHKYKYSSAFISSLTEVVFPPTKLKELMKRRDEVWKIASHLPVSENECVKLIVEEILDRVRLDVMFTFKKPEQVRGKTLEALRRALERDKRLFL